MEEYRAEGEGVVKMRGFSFRLGRSPPSAADHVTALAFPQPHQPHQHWTNAIDHYIWVPDIQTLEA